MRKEMNLRNMCSPMLAASAGTAICLSGGGVQGAIQTGNIANSNAGQTIFSGGGTPYAVTTMNILGSIASIWWNRPNVLSWSGSAQPNAPHINADGTYVNFHNAGVTVSSGITGNFSAYARILPSQGASYLAVRFNSGGVKFGWIEVISTNAAANQITLGDWGYEDSGASIKTLSESVVGKQLRLINGGVKLHWTNKNEQGVARYEVQRKASGAWIAVESEIPGAGRYDLKTVPGDYRLVIEKVDGTTEEVQFQG